MEISQKKRLLVYGITALLSMAGAYLLAYYAGMWTVLYSVMWSVLSVGVACCIARGVCHALMKDLTPEFWQIEIYLAVTVIGWLGFILSTTWTLASVSLAFTIGGAVLSIGHRWLQDKNLGLVTKSVIDDDLYTTLRYRWINNEFRGTLDLNTPLILDGREPVTIKEAEERGLRIEASEAKAYITKCKEAY
jgi:MFS family permease